MAKRKEKHGTYDIAADMQRILNTKPEDTRAAEEQDELKRLVSMWLASGPDTTKMLHDNPGCLPNTGTCIFQPTRSGRLTVSFFPAHGADAGMTPAESAMKFFLQFVTAEDCERLSGKCKCGCGQFVLRGSLKDQRKVYLTGHGSRATASEFMRKEQAAARASRVRRINRVVRKYVDLHLRKDWVIYVCTETGIPTRTIKLWERKGYIDTPEKLKGAKA